MPYHELERIKFTVKGFMPFTNQIVTGKDEDITGRRENPFKFIQEIRRSQLLQIPLSYIIVNLAAPIKFHIASRVFCQIIGRIA